MLMRFIIGLWLLISVACTRNGFEPSFESERGTKHRQAGPTYTSAALNPYWTFIKISKVDLSKEVLSKNVVIFFNSYPYALWKYPLKHLVERKDDIHWLSGLGFPSNGDTEIKTAIKVVAFIGEDETKGILVTSEVPISYMPRPNGRVMLLLSLKSTDSKELDMEIKAKLVGEGDPEYPKEWPGRPSNDSGLPPEEAPGLDLKNKL